MNRKPMAWLVPALLLLATACASNEPVPAPTGGADSGAAVGALRVCALVDLEPLAATLGSTGYEDGPKDIPPGVGVDPGGPQCSAQFALPPRGTTVVIPAMLNVAVVAHPGADAAAASFAQRVAEVSGFANAEVEDLPGDWTAGKVTTAEGTGSDLVYALVQQDDRLVKFDLKLPSGTGKLQEAKATVVAQLGELATAVAAEVAG